MIQSFDQFLDLYRVSGQPNQCSSIKMLHTNLTKIVNGLFTKTVLDQTIRMAEGLLSNNENRKILVQNGGIPDTKEKISFHLEALKQAFIAIYKEDQQLSDDEDDLESEISGDDIIQILTDKCKEANLLQSTAPTLRPLSLEEQLQRQFAHFPETKTFDQIGYAYTKGRMGASSKFMQQVLEGNFYSLDNRTTYAYPHDADDLARCIFYLEDYLTRKGRNDLTQGEKQSLSSSSQKWSGIVLHLHELREAIHTNQPMDLVTKQLQKCMNNGKLQYAANEQDKIDTGQQEQIERFLSECSSSEEATYVFELGEAPRVFANELIQTMHRHDYRVDFVFSNHGGVNGERRLTRGTEISYLERSEYHHGQMSLRFSKMTEEDKTDSGILEFRYT